MGEESSLDVSDGEQIVATGRGARRTGFFPWMFPPPPFPGPSFLSSFLQPQVGVTERGDVLGASDAGTVEVGSPLSSFALLSFEKDAEIRTKGV